MKRKIYILCFICLSGTNLLWAGSKLFADVNHFVALYGGVGYQNLISNSTQIHSSQGVAPSIGIGYRYLRNGFVIQVGVESEYAYITSKIQDEQTITPTIDSENDAFLLHASFTQGTDITRSAILFLPVLIGIEKHRFYGLAGIKAGVCVYGDTKASTIISTQGEYERYMEYFSQMPNHNLQDNVPNSSAVYPMRWSNPSLQAHLELGARLDQPTTDPLTKHIYRLYIGIYADYGLLNAHQNMSLGNRITYTQSETQGIGTFSVLPSLVSEQMLNYRINPLTIGVKCTASIELPMKKKCIMCRD